MTCRVHNVKALGLLFLLVVVLGAVAAASASAADWEVKKQKFEVLELESEKITGTASGATKITLTKLGVAIKCTSGTASGSVILGGFAKMTIELSKCSVVNSEDVENKNCTVTSPITFEGKSELLEAEGSLYSTLSPVSGESFTTIKISGEKCPITTASLSGQAAGGLSGKEGVEQSLVFSEKAASAAATSLNYGANSAVLSGTLVLKLSGGHAESAWNAVYIYPFSTDPAAPDLGTVARPNSVKVVIKLLYAGILNTLQMAATTIQNSTESVFSIVPGSDQCVNQVLSQTNNMCQVEVEFKPAAAGVRTAFLKFKETGTLPRSYRVMIKATGT